MSYNHLHHLSSGVNAINVYSFVAGLNSAAGNGTRVSHVTGGTTNHYTTAELAYLQGFLVAESCPQKTYTKTVTYLFMADAEPELLP